MKKKCIICNNKTLAKNYCSKHYGQLYIFGKIKRTKFDKNEIIKKGRYSIICLYNAFGIKINETIVDTDEIEKIKKYKWHMSNYYVANVTNGKTIKLHQIIMGKQGNLEIDHINRNKLDNRKQNLRFVTRTQNNLNRNVLGITWDKSRKKWLAQIAINKKHIYLGRFENKEDALLARKKSEELYKKLLTP